MLVTLYVFLLSQRFMTLSCTLVEALQCELICMTSDFMFSKNCFVALYGPIRKAVHLSPVLFGFHSFLLLLLLDMTFEAKFAC